MDNYYLPNLEEFHIGFEYEIKLNSGDWVKHKLTALSELNFEDWSIKQNDVRVKYLDEQDILELGWQKKAKKFDLGVETYVKTIDLFGFNNNRIHLLYNINNVWKMLIQNNNSYGTPSVEIKLNVKNKSELRRLMQQMGILVVDYYTYPGCNIEIGLKPYVHDSSMI